MLLPLLLLLSLSLSLLLLLLVMFAGANSDKQQVGIRALNGIMESGGSQVTHMLR